MATKRKIDDVSENTVRHNLKIMIVDKEIAKNTKLYQFPPKTLNSVPPPPNLPDSWFTFSTSKEYYPVGIFDGDKLITTDPKKAITITFGIFSNDKNAAPYETKAKPLKSGVYWFSVVKAHAAEQLSLRFSGEGVEALSFEIEVIHSEKSKSIKCDATQLVTETDSTSVSAKNSRRISARFIAPLEAPVIVALEEELSESTKQSPAEQLVPQDTLQVEQHSEDNVTGCTTSTSGNFVESIFPMPLQNTLTEKTRLEQPLISGGKANDAVLIKGPLFEARLPLALVRAVLNDKATNNSRVTEYLEEVAALNGTHEGSSTNSGKSKIPQVPLNLSNPSAGVLFQRLHERALSDISCGGEQVEGCVETLRQLFEYFLEDHLLYPAERVALRQRINLLRSQRGAFADEFGPYHFLRLLVLVISGAEIVGGATSDKVNSSSSSKSGQSDSAVNSITNYFTVATAGSKGAARQSKNGHSKMQEVLELAISILDEQAHVLFY